MAGKHTLRGSAQRLLGILVNSRHLVAQFAAAAKINLGVFHGVFIPFTPRLLLTGIHKC